jgi:hypothetical protein
MQNLLYIFLIGPTLLAGYYWYVEEYRYTGTKLSLQQLVLLCFFMGYIMYCSNHGAGVMLALYNDYSYQAGRALSVTGLWTFIVPGIIAALIIFPRETLLYACKSIEATPLSVFITRLTAILLMLLTWLRHSLVS